MHRTIAELVSCDSRGSSLDGMPQAQLAIDPHITFNAICSKPAAKILALVAVVIGDGAEVNSAAHRLAGPCFPPCCTRAERALNEAARACAGGARDGKRIRIKPMKLLDSGIGKQATTGRRKRVGKDFRHRQAPGTKEPQYMGS
jgi:hypothetical protein